MNQKEIVASYTGLALAGRAWWGSMVLSSEKCLWLKIKLVGEDETTRDLTQFVSML